MTAHRLVSALIVLLLLTGACGIPEDNDPVAISAEIPTVPPVTPTTVPAEEDASTVKVFLLDVNENMAEVERELSGTEITITDLVGELIADTSDEEKALGLTTALPSGLTFSPGGASLDGDLAVLDFVSGGIDLLEGGEQKSALAQLVWTLTATEEISRISIRIDGVEESWPTDGDDASILTKGQYATFDPAFIDVVVPTPTPEPEDTEG